MTKPLFADAWYGKLPVDEVRKEVQKLYEIAGTTDAYSQAEVDALLATRAASAHTHVATDITDLAALLAAKSDTGHTHTTSAITNLSSYTGLDVRYYTETEADALLAARLPLTGGTVTGLLTVVESGTVQLEVRNSVSNGRAQFLAGGTDETFIRNADSAGTVDGSLILKGSDDTIRFRPGTTAGTQHEMWHNGNVPVETGTFTPVVESDATHPTVTHTTQTGNYYRVGNMIFIEGRIAWSSLSGGSGNVRIAGLPFTAGATGHPNSLGYGNTPAGAASAGRYSIHGVLVSGTTEFNIVASGLATTRRAIPVSELTGGADIYFSFNYTV